MNQIPEAEDIRYTIKHSEIEEFSRQIRLAYEKDLHRKAIIAAAGVFFGAFTGFLAGAGLVCVYLNSFTP